MWFGPWNSGPRSTRPNDLGRAGKFQVDGISFIELLNFDNFHEGNGFIDNIFTAQRLAKTRITSVTGYDKKGRSDYGKSKSGYLLTLDISETLLDFTGKPIIYV